MNRFSKEEASDLFNKEKVHFILSHSYFLFLFAAILGVIIDLFIPIRIFITDQSQYLGLLIMALSSVLVYWAQSSSSNYKNKPKKHNTHSDFERGPYKYTRHPTHLGLFALTVGFGLVINSPFSIILSLVSYIITILLFLKKEEKLLIKKYGQEYQDYKKKIKNWI